MLRTSKSYFELAGAGIFLCLILAGVGLRFWHLHDVPFGIDSDQANVLSWGRQSIESQKFPVFADASTDFEALSSYLFAATEKVFGDAHWLSLIFSLADLVLLVLLLRQCGTSLFLSLAAGALLATCPMALYYARIAGPCVGASTLLLLFLWWSNRRGGTESAWGQGLWLLLGLLYYSIFRILFVYEVLGSIKTRNVRRLVSALAAVSVVGTAALLSGHGGVEAQFRGLYNFPQSWSEIGSRIGDWLSLWFFAPSSRFVEPSPEFIVDPVTQGFAWILGAGPALGVGMSLLLILAIFQWLSEGCPLPDRPRRFFLFAFFALLISPTYSHAIWILPLVPLFIVLAFEKLIRPQAKMQQMIGWILTASILISGVSGLGQSYAILDRLRTPGQYDEVFGDRIRKVFETHIQSDLPGLPVLYFTGQQYYLARYWGERFPRAQVLPGLSVPEALRLLRRQTPRGDRLVVYFDVQNLHYHWADREEAKEQRDLVKEVEKNLRIQAEVLNVDEIREFDQLTARRYVIRWN